MCVYIRKNIYKQIPANIYFAWNKYLITFK